MSNSENLKFYLRTIASMSRSSVQEDFKFSGMPDLVLQMGREMKPIALPQNIKLGYPQHCYYNAQALAKRLPTLIYCEGFALAESSLIPVPHAWVMDRQWQAIDPTWERSKYPEAIYLGIPLHINWVRAVLSARAKTGNKDIAILEGNYARPERGSFYRSGLPTKAIAGFNVPVS